MQRFKQFKTILEDLDNLLYNEANELIAVAKTNRPIPKAKNVDMTFVVKFDI